ncbi:glycoside hydrolase family 25 protein [Consotaella salsifontis]|uniref:glycoside hydrolase family 25 protein n=1 Tax=Consotaella salsifontis TaxID=1365950 RepID=UPI00315AC359
MTAIVLVFAAAPAEADYNKPWKQDDRALVIDAYEFNPIDWKELTADKRIAGFINKASDGLPPEWNCSGKSGDEELLCKNRWWKYSVTKELYMTRREMAKTLGLKWGAYHLGRPGNPREQADHFVDFAEPAPDELIALDIEDNTSDWMSLADAEIFANQIKIRLGRYPVLYTNGSTAKWIAEHKADYPLLSRLPLWYARYREDITGLFPTDTWPTYALWQFSSMHNCNAKSCPYRVKGAKNDIDVNVASLDVEGLKAAWPFNDLVDRQDDAPANGSSLIASLEDKAELAVKAVAGSFASVKESFASATKVAQAQARTSSNPSNSEFHSMMAAYGPSTSRAPVDPLKLISEAAYQKPQVSDWKHADPVARSPEPAPATKPVASAKTTPVDSLRDARGEMRAVASIVSATKNPIVVPAPKVPANALEGRGLLSKEQKSRLQEMLRTAANEDKAEATLPMPAYVLSQETAIGAGRGPRLASTSETPESADNRVLLAFEATR